MRTLVLCYPLPGIPQNNLSKNYCSIYYCKCSSTYNLYILGRLSFKLNNVNTI